jgi:GNAT superfamily N-acetyltransferase
MRIAAELSPAKDEVELVLAGLQRHNDSCVPPSAYEDMAVFARDDDGRVIGGALCEVGRGWLHISVLWVDDRHRGRGLGRQIVAETEAEARRRGCHSAYLDTFSYQARPFYEKLGYAVCGILDDYPTGHQRYFMTKKLAVTDRPASRGEGDRG